MYNKMYTLKFTTNGRIINSMVAKIPKENIILSNYELCRVEIGRWTESVKEYMDWYIDNHMSAEYEILEAFVYDDSDNLSQLTITLHESIWKTDIAVFQINICPNE